MRPRRPDRTAALAGIPRELVDPHVEDFVDAEDVEQLREVVALEQWAGARRSAREADAELATRLTLRATVRYALARADHLERERLPECAAPFRGPASWRNTQPRALCPEVTR